MGLGAGVCDTLDTPTIPFCLPGLMVTCACPVACRCALHSQPRRVVCVEPLQNLLPLLPALLIPQTGPAALGAASAGTAPAALMADTACDYWKHEGEGEQAHVNRPLRERPLHVLLSYRSSLVASFSFTVFFA